MSGTTSPSRLRSAFAGPRKPALVAYLMAGDPSLSATRDIALAIHDAIDVLELGIPFSDPIADGPTIQRAAVRSLANGTMPESVLDLVRDLRSGKHPFTKPIVVMTYYNILFHMDLSTFVRRAAEAGIDGLVVPDLPLEESAPLSKLARERGIDLVQLASPASDEARLAQLAKATRGFLYLVGLYGVTGARGSVADETLELVQRACGAVAGRVPIAVGFGVSAREHVEALAKAGADGVVVGSAIVERVEKGAGPGEVAAFVAGLR